MQSENKQPTTKKGDSIMKKMIALVLSLVAVLALFAGCSKKDANSDLAYVQKKGTLIVGITDYAPMDYKDDSGNWTGFDAEFAQAVAAKLGVNCEFIEIDWGKKFFELETKNIDCIWNGMTITDEVKLNTSVSNPYVKNAQVVVMDKSKAGGYTSADAIKGLTFAVEAGSAGAAELDALGITDYTAVQAQSNALMEVAAGTCDACVIDITMANAMTGEGTGYPDLTTALELSSEEYGIGFRKGSDLTAKVNEIMKGLMSDGTLDALAAKYELSLVK